MNIFGRTDRDLDLLRLNPAELKLEVAADLCAVYEQLEHHCIRLAWKEHARSGVPVRNVLRVVSGNAHIRLMEAVPNEEPEHDEDLLHALINDAQRTNEVKVCLGFLLDDECRNICRAAVDNTRSLADGVFQTIPWHLIEATKTSRLVAARNALLTLRKLWNEYRCNVATHALTRETVRIVAAATEMDPQLSEATVLNRRLQLLNSFIDEYEADNPFSRRAPSEPATSNG